jgi:hypothetical protein
MPEAGLQRFRFFPCTLRPVSLRRSVFPVPIVIPGLLVFIVPALVRRTVAALVVAVMTSGRVGLL